LKLPPGCEEYFVPWRITYLPVWIAGAEYAGDRTDENICSVVEESSFTALGEHVKRNMAAQEIDHSMNEHPLAK
jgi:hypothetical protein